MPVLSTPKGYDITKPLLRQIAEASMDPGQWNSLMSGEDGETLSDAGIKKDVLRSIGQISASQSGRGDDFTKKVTGQLSILRQAVPESIIEFEQQFIAAISEQRSEIFRETAAERTRQMGTRVMHEGMQEVIAAVGGGGTVQDRIAAINAAQESHGAEVSSVGTPDIEDQGYHSPGGSDVSRGSSPEAGLAGGEQGRESTAAKTKRLGGPPPAYVPAPEFGQPVVGKHTKQLEQQANAAAAQDKGGTGR